MRLLAVLISFQEGRWLWNSSIIDDYGRFWFRGGGEPRKYTFWAAHALLQRYVIHALSIVFSYLAYSTLDRSPFSFAPGPFSIQLSFLTLRLRFAPPFPATHTPLNARALYRLDLIIASPATSESQS